MFLQFSCFSKIQKIIIQEPFLEKEAIFLKNFLMDISKNFDDKLLKKDF